MLPAPEVRNGIRFVETPDPGTGRQFLLVHGLGGSLENWAYVQRGLMPHGRTIAIDMPGFGDGPALKTFDLDVIADRIGQFCVDADLKQAVMVSHSIGTPINAAVSVRHRELFSRLVIVSGALSRADDMVHRPSRALIHPFLGISVAMQFLLGGSRPAPALQRLAARSGLLKWLTLWPFVASPSKFPADVMLETLKYSGSPTVYKIFSARKRFDYDASLREVTLPVDLIWGDSDKLITKKDVERLRKLVNLQRVLQLKDTGHWAPMERPVEVTQFILDTPQE
jgi:pimeloyl-ACP methyl ester carboxylesterase